MLKTIEEKLSAIKAINDEKERIDAVLQTMDLNPTKALDINISGRPAGIHLTQLMQTELLNLVKSGLQTKRAELINNATELMK